ncbi:MAG: prepilin-type N-terminal cleavage/methylation domain-containing protein [Limnobacter sp.]|nr:prepilin-type N-terminal cleavage/methylation domain-containing protein [Limnobacter sp.]
MPKRFNTTKNLKAILPSQQGFSLLELAIALAVLAVLAGGVLKGSELIQSAKVQSTVTEITNIDTAVSAFEGRYAALPGDFAGASAAGLGSFSGNGNGLVDTAGEQGAVFEHLQRAGFIKGQFTSIELTGATCPETSCPASPLGGTFVMGSTLLSDDPANGSIQLLLGNATRSKKLADIDRKLDDGKAESGDFLILATEGSTCTTDEGLWDEASESNCQAAYKLR